MNDKEKNFRNSYKVEKIDIPMDNGEEKNKNKPQKEYKNTWKNVENKIEEYKKIAKKARLFTGENNSFIEAETVTKLEKAIENLEKADREYSEIERKLEEAKKTIKPSEEWKLQGLYEERLLKRNKLEITSEKSQEIFENYKSEVERKEPEIPRFVNRNYNAQHLRNTETPKKTLKKADAEKQSNKHYKTSKSKRERAKRIAKKFATIGTILSLIAGGTVWATNEIGKVMDKPVNIQTAKEKLGKTPEQMGISEETEEKILELNEKIQVDSSQLSMKDVKQMAIENYQVSQEVVEEKFSNLLNVNEEDITFDAKIDIRDNSRRAYAYIGDNETYKYDNFTFTFNNTMPEEVGTYIINLKQNRQLLNDLDYDNCDKEDAIEEIKKSIDSASRLAGGQDLYLKDGKIKVNTTRNSDIEKQNRNDEKDINSSQIYTNKTVQTENER